LKDEIDEKRREVAVFEEQIGQIEKLKDSASSLSDELEEVNVIACKLCSEKFLSSYDLKEHMRTFHEERLEVKHELLMKLDRIQKTFPFPFPLDILALILAVLVPSFVSTS
jgi:hypothetical protein